MLICWLTGGGVDYNSEPYNVTFLAGMTHASFNVAIINDIVSEDNETFDLIIELSSLPSNVTAINPEQATVTIVDDDDGKYIIMKLLLFVG